MAIVKAWVSTHTRADGGNFYTAHISLRGRILWFIPTSHVHDVVLLPREESFVNYETFGIQSRDSNLEAPYQFLDKEKAEEVLIEQIYHVLDMEQEKRDSKVVKKEKEYVNLCPANDQD